MHARLVLAASITKYSVDAYGVRCTYPHLMGKIGYEILLANVTIRSQSHKRSSVLRVAAQLVERWDSSGAGQTITLDDKEEVRPVRIIVATGTVR